MTPNRTPPKPAEPAPVKPAQPAAFPAPTGPVMPSVSGNSPQSAPLNLAVEAQKPIGPLPPVKRSAQETVYKWLADSKAKMLPPHHRNQLEQLEEMLPELVKMLEGR